MTLPRSCSPRRSPAGRTAPACSMTQLAPISTGHRLPCSGFSSADTTARSAVDEGGRDPGGVLGWVAEEARGAVGALEVAVGVVFPGDADGAVQLDHLGSCLGQGL